jgi:ribosomal protein L21E
MMIKIFGITLCAFLIGIFLFLGCNVSPPENEIRNEIIKHFEDRHYKVIDIDISAIESIPQHEKLYMGKEGYIVRLKSVTLEVQNPEDTKGRRLIYENGTVRIRKSTDQLQKWIITDISNMEVL